MKSKHDQFIINSRIVLCILLFFNFFGLIYLINEESPMLIEESYDINYNLENDTTDFTLNLKFHKVRFWEIRMLFYDETNKLLETRTDLFHGGEVALTFNDIQGKVATYEIESLYVEGSIVLPLVLIFSFCILLIVAFLSFFLKTQTKEIHGKTYLVYAGFVNHYLYEDDVLVDSKNGFSNGLIITLEKTYGYVKIKVVITGLNTIRFEVSNPDFINKYQK